ncbi:uncharacterized protein LOC126375565 [Pectinophora gossypiella]|uniref:uncharacterized protein LOC126375565 n=1 Tax=Pectinophora gossypiella TaxID=13191 RepID=UPI00214F38E5|nr:uncharacterized protein LOC126375565 [Pectinophora gossypiella]
MNENQIEEFIDEVESRPAIWDSRSDKYSNKIEKKKAWEEICNKFIENFTNKTASEKNEASILLQRKWKNLRDSYSRELNKQRASKSGSAASSHRKYQHFDRLQFLSCLSETRPIDISTQPSTSKKRKVSEQPVEDDTNKILKILIERMQKKDESIENDGDRCFLLSLLSDFKKIPEHRKTDAKYEMIGLIRRFINDNFEYSYQQHHGYFTSTNQSSQSPANVSIQESPSQLTDMSSIYENLFSESNDNI